MKELTPEIVRTFIKRIEVHERIKIDGKKTQQVDVYFNGLDDKKF